MADEKEEIDAEKAAEEKAGGGAGRWIAIIVILLVFIGAQVGLALMFKDMLTPEDPAVAALKEQQELDAAARQKMTAMGVTLEKPIDVMVNIHGTNGERFLKTSIQLEYNAEKAATLAPLLMERMPKIKNQIIQVLSTRPMEELLTAEGKSNLLNTIVADVNSALPEKVDEQEVGKVERAFFDSFIIQ
jgi:flagellar FliL protein